MRLGRRVFANGARCVRRLTAVPIVDVGNDARSCFVPLLADDERCLTVALAVLRVV